MRGSRLSREARRRPDLDLIAGPREAMAAAREGSERDNEPPIELVSLPHPSDAPTFGEEG